MSLSVFRDTIGYLDTFVHNSCINDEGRRETLNERYHSKLLVNKKPVELNPFVEEFLSHTVVGAVTSLKGVENIQRLQVHQKKGNVEITVNGGEIPLTPFPNDIISNTLLGMVSSLRDVDDMDSIDISVEVQ